MVRWTEYVFVVLFAIATGMILGAVVSHSREEARINYLSTGGFAVDGTVVPRIAVCSKGCRTSDDIVCSQFLQVLHNVHIPTTEDTP